MLSTKLGYGRPASSARCFAAAFCASVSSVDADLRLGLRRFHGGGVNSVMTLFVPLAIEPAVSLPGRELVVDTKRAANATCCAATQIARNASMQVAALIAPGRLEPTTSQQLATHQQLATNVRCRRSCHTANT